MCHLVILISEALIELTEDETIWQGDSQDERLRQAYVQFSAECRQHRVSHLVASSLNTSVPPHFFKVDMMPRK